MTSLEVSFAPPISLLPASVELRAEHLRLRVGKEAFVFHYIWLRHNAPEDVHPKTRERVLDARDVALDIKPTEVAIEGTDLVLKWTSGVSRYRLAWLVEHAYAKDSLELTPPPSDAARITLQASDFATLDDLRDAVLPLTESLGAAVVRNAGLDTDAILEALARRGLTVRGTHFGRIEDLRTDNTTNQNTDQLGYTDVAVDLHTDQPFLEDAPRYQMLHAIRVADEGGENILVDARAATRYLRAVDSDAFRILTTTPITFHRKQAAFEKILTSPLLRVDAEGELLQVRHSYFTFAPFTLPFDATEPFYRAYQRFARIIHDPAHQWRVLLQPGDFVLYDNHRTLHARTGFRGPRWVRGVYFDAKG